MRLTDKLHFRLMWKIDSEQFHGNACAYLLADGRPARFAGGENSVTLFAQEFDEIGDMGGLAGAFGAFEGDENGGKKVIGQSGNWAIGERELVFKSPNHLLPNP